MKKCLGKVEEKPYGGWHPPLLRPRVKRLILTRQRKVELICVSYNETSMFFLAQLQNEVIFCENY